MISWEITKIRIMSLIVKLAKMVDSSSQLENYQKKKSHDSRKNMHSSKLARLS